MVHTSYGIGKFINISASPDSGDEEMNILYRDNTILHVPLSQAHLVSRYIGLGSKTPELNKLGDSKWQRAKNPQNDPWRITPPSSSMSRRNARQEKATATPGQQMDVGI